MYDHHIAAYKIRELYFLDSWGIKIVLHIVPHGTVTLILFEVNCTGTGLYAVSCILYSVSKITNFTGGESQPIPGGLTEMYQSYKTINTSRPS